MCSGTLHCVIDAKHGQCTLCGVCILQLSNVFYNVCVDVRGAKLSIAPCNETRLAHVSNASELFPPNRFLLHETESWRACVRACVRACLPACLRVCLRTCVPACERVRGKCDWNGSDGFECWVCTQ